MSEPNVEGPFIVAVEKNGLMAIDICKNFSLWEVPDDTDMQAGYVHIDTAGAGADLQYDQIPAVIHFLEKVYQKRVVEGERDLHVCPNCGGKYV